MVDDEAPIRRVISLVMSGMGIDTIEASDAESALEIVDHEDISLMIVDRRLPGMDGAQFVRAIRKGTSSDLPVIMISAHGEPAQHSADKFVHKPFDIEDLSDAVEEVMGKPHK